jgi:hypothetical protein
MADNNDRLAEIERKISQQGLTQFTPVNPQFEEREIRVDFDRSDRPVFRLLSVNCLFVTFRRYRDEPDPSETWAVQRIKLLGRGIGSAFDADPVILPGDVAPDVPWWLLTAVVKARAFVSSAGVLPR